MRAALEAVVDEERRRQAEHEAEAGDDDDSLNVTQQAFQKSSEAKRRS